MLEQYLSGSIAHLETRAQRLIARIPRNLPREYAVLEQTCRAAVNEAIRKLRGLSTDAVYQNAAAQSVRLREYRRVVADLDVLEANGIMALMRQHSDDQRLNGLVDQIRSEIRYPLPAPVISSLSRQYFEIRSDLNLLLVPLIEADFLLHLPDLYHELAHPLLSVVNDPALESFQITAFYGSLTLVTDYLQTLERQEDRRHGPKAYGLLLKKWIEAWIPYWLNEFFCDAFAACTLGPAYAWAHLGLAPSFETTG